MNSNYDSVYKKLPENIYLLGVPNILPEPDPSRLWSCIKNFCIGYSEWKFLSILICGMKIGKYCNQFFTLLHFILKNEAKFKVEFV